MKPFMLAAAFLALTACGSVDRSSISPGLGGEIVGAITPDNPAIGRDAEPIRIEPAPPAAAARQPAVPSPTSPQGSQSVMARPPALEEDSPPDGRWGMGSCGPWIGGKPPICTDKASS